MAEAEGSDRAPDQANSVLADLFGGGNSVFGGGKDGGQTKIYLQNGLQPLNANVLEMGYAP